VTVVAVLTSATACVLSCLVSRPFSCRIGVLSLLFIPALGWVAFNILQPALNQLNRMSEIKDDAKSSSSSGRKKRGLAGAVGMGAALSMFAAQQAEAATEVAQLAGDNRWVG
jgi:photosystem II PsbY protein